MSKRKRKKKSRRQRKAAKRQSRPRGGIMMSMRRGFQKAAGSPNAEQSKTGSSFMSKIWTALLIIAVGVVVYYRFFSD